MPQPPKPQAAFRIGITGHRWDRLPRGFAPHVEAHVEAVLAAVETALGHPGVATPLQRSDPPLLTLLSGLAEGADRLAAVVALRRPGWRLHAVLPFDIDAYEDDFTRETSAPDSLAEFRSCLLQATLRTTLDGKPGHYDAYVPLGRILVDQCDLLIVVWDGEPARGPGGTANVVEMARRDDVPLVRVDVHNPGQAWLEDLDRPDHGRSNGLTALVPRLATLLAPPAGAQAAQDFLKEQVPTTRPPRLYDRVVALLAGDGRHSSWRRFWAAGGPPIDRDPGVARAARWRAEWTALPPDVLDDVVQRFAAWQGWADELARWYAAKFRQTFTAVFLLAATAVLAAGVGTMDLPSNWGWGAHFPEVIEILCLVEMFRRVRVGRRQRYHERWLDYRSLAERLRHLAFLWPLARTVPLVRVPDVDATGDSGGGWVGWFLRTVVREAGLVSADLNAHHVNQVREFLLTSEIAPQRAFHSTATKRAARVHHPMERWAERLVVLAIVLAILRLSDVIGFVMQDVMGWTLKRVLVFESRFGAALTAAAVTLPALAASVHGFLGTGDFEGTAIRSAAIEPRLAQLGARLRRLTDPDLLQVGDTALDLAQAMEGELGTWHQVARSRRAQLT